MASEYMIPLCSNPIDTSMEMSCDEEMRTHEKNEVDLGVIFEKTRSKINQTVSKWNLVGRTRAEQDAHMAIVRRDKKIMHAKKAINNATKHEISNMKETARNNRDSALHHYSFHGRESFFNGHGQHRRAENPHQNQNQMNRPDPYHDKNRTEEQDLDQLAKDMENNDAPKSALYPDPRNTATNNSVVNNVYIV